MRPKLRIITEHRPNRARGARDTAQRRLRAGRKAQAVAPACEGQDQREAAAKMSLQVPEQHLMLHRVRGAGGPTDNASYTCECGYVFAASVSTTVSCPRCGTSQAW
ncbi:MAG TPA: hypothetical protein VIC05_05140 [Solirubrobacteraceae bacterium]|jgi:rubrerythrin